MRIGKKKFSGQKTRIVLKSCIRIYLFPLFIVGYILRIYDNYNNKNREVDYKIDYYE